MHLNKFVQSNTGRIIMSILLGMGLATFFREVCIGKYCKVQSSPPIDDLENNIYKFDNKCYKFDKQHVECKRSKNTVKIA